MENQQPIYNLPAASGHQSFMQELTNPVRILTNMELRLKRKQYDRLGNLITYGQPLLNNLGVADVRSIVESAVNQVMILSRIEKEEVREIGIQTAEALIDLLMTKYRLYEIDAENNYRNKNAVRTQIMTIAMNTIHSVLSRARMGDDKRFWKGGINEQHSIIKEEHGTDGKFSLPNPFRKG